MRSVPFSGSSSERLAGCSTCWGVWEGWEAGAGRLEGVCLQMDNEMGWMTATHTLPPFSVVWTQKPRQRSIGDAGHSAHRQAHRADTCWRQRRGPRAEAEAGPRRTRGAEAGKSPLTLGKASLFLGLALGPVYEEAGGDQGAPTLPVPSDSFLKENRSWTPQIQGYTFRS